jgi:hypothetical protein
MTRGTIHEILTNEKYVGNNVYNRTSTKLQHPRVTNDPAAWVRCNNAYQPVIDPTVFAKAQAIIHERDHRYTDEELLQRLRNLFQQHGMLSGIIIDEAAGMPSTATYASRFHSLRRAYELVGYTLQRLLRISRSTAPRLHRARHTHHQRITSTGATIHRDAPTS